MLAMRIDIASIDANLSGRFGFSILLSMLGGGRSSSIGGDVCTLSWTFVQLIRLWLSYGREFTKLDIFHEIGLRPLYKYSYYGIQPITAGANSTSTPKEKQTKEKRKQ